MTTPRSEDPTGVMYTDERLAPQQPRRAITIPLPTPRRRGGNNGNAGPNETKPFFLTSEFWVLVVIALGVLIAAAWIGGDNTKANGATVNHDAFPAVRAWLYIVIIGAAYLLSRGLAKSGVRDWPDDGNDGNGTNA